MLKHKDMRKIKFRGKRIDNEQWVYGGFHYHKEIMLCFSTEEEYNKNKKFLIVIDGMSDWNLPVPINCYEVYPESVGQFTGLLDKNGKEIYEGDILRLLETISTDDPAYPYYCDTMEVCYCEPHCRFGLTDGGAILDIPSNVEVIGNKFENPDLC